LFRRFFKKTKKMDDDVEFLMNVLFDNYDNSVGLNKPQPLISNIDTLVQHHQCVVCPNIFIPIPLPLPLPIIHYSKSFPEMDSFRQIVHEVLKACSIEMYISSFYIGPNWKDWAEFMPTVDVSKNTVDIVWMDEPITDLPNAQIYVFRSNFLEQYVSQFENVYLVSPKNTNNTYIVASQRINTNSIKVCMHNLCLRFRWKRNQQQLQFQKLQKWGKEHNQENPKWDCDEVTYIPVSPKYKRTYIPISPKYKRSKTLAELWLDNNIIH
jgi:hypothetical protein